MVFSWRTHFLEFQIELHIFSGVVNPTWTVTSDSSDFNNIKSVLTQAPSTTLPSVIGYQGFVVMAYFSDGTKVEQIFGKGQQTTTTIETTLLNSNNGTLSSDVESIAVAAINGLVIRLRFPNLMRNFNAFLLTTDEKKSTFPNMYLCSKHGLGRYYIYVPVFGVSDQV